MDLRTPVHTTGFLPPVASKPGSANTSPPFTGPTQAPTAILDSSIEAEEIGIEVLKPTQPPTVLDKALN